MKISPSIASANQLQLGHEVMKIQDHYDDLHIDIEDGNFIPNITFGLKTIQSLRSVTTLPFSFHLMVTNPYEYIEQIKDLSPSIIFAHIESLPYPSDFLARVKKANLRCGLAFNPITPIEPYLYLLKQLDAVLIMTSEPDGQGQLFNKEMVEKVRKVAKNHKFQGEIWVDGGVKYEHLPFLDEAGATHAVMGRAVFGG
ncbi:ribulose-phosphate 3-epimerase [Ferdinandcohnia sp. Marseille-Q9671]